MMIDLRSDTVTQPTEEMRRAMYEAEVGDDVYGDDPTVNRLEQMAAERVGKEAALMVVSGTMGNQVSLMAQTSYGHQIIAGAECHIFGSEGGAAARLSGINMALVQNPDTMVHAADVQRLVTPANDPHFPITDLVCVENALCNGDVMPLSVMRETYDEAHRHGLRVHLDGARMFNAALALNTEVKELAACADSLTFCLSKGLCAPVGAMICGDREFVSKARRMRKIVGGGMRQAGIIAACGIVALEKMTLRLHEDHAGARYLADLMDALPSITVQRDRLKINMVFWKTSNPKFDSDAFIRFMHERNVRVYGILGDEYRFAVHHDITKERMEYAVEQLRAYIETL